MLTRLIMVHIFLPLCELFLCAIAYKMKSVQNFVNYNFRETGLYARASEMGIDERQRQRFPPALTESDDNWLLTKINQ